VSFDPFEGLPRNHFGCIAADPPWAFKTFSEKGLDKSPQAHYPCLNLDDIKALPVADLAAKDCVLLMWCISPMVHMAYEVVQAWGFRPNTFGGWGKLSKTGMHQHMSTGFFYRGAGEWWIMAVRGKPKPLSRSIRNFILAPVREHSRKPDEFYEDHLKLCDGPHLELFAREHREGWVGWGNEYGLLSPPGLSRSLSLLGGALDGAREARAA
jgi:N6-adenosine-specific RNA methylase IME4